MPMTTAPPKIYRRGEIPRVDDMADYLSRVRAVSGRLFQPPGTPDPPDDMNHLNFQAANNIELALLGAERAVNALEHGFVQSGEFQAGGF